MGGNAGSTLRHVGDDIGNFVVGAADDTSNFFTGVGDDVAQIVDDCPAFNRAHYPDKQNPTSNKEILNHIKPCTLYEIDEETQQPDITKLLLDPKDPKFGNSFTIPDYCAPNVAIFGADYSQGYQTSFIDEYCKNITPITEENLSPQDIILKSYLPEYQPEWLSAKEASFVVNEISKSKMAPQIFSLANTSRINFQITNNSNASNTSNEKPLEVSDEPNKDIAKAEEELREVQHEQMVKTSLNTTIGVMSGITAGLAFGPEGLAVAGAVALGGVVYDVIKEDDCYYNDAHVPEKISSYGCCRGKCAIRGKGGSCQRNVFGYKADPFQCCLQDFNCSTNNGKNAKTNDINDSTLNLCYQKKDDGRTYACDPHYRGMNQPFCREMLFGYCTGQIPYLNNQSSLLQAWVPGSDPVNVNGFETSAPCLNFLARLLSDDAGVCNWDDFINKVPHIVKTDVKSVNLITAQNMMDELLQTYLRVHGNPVQAINTDGYYENSEFIKWYFNFCQKYPLLCQDSLRNNLCSDYNLNDLADNPSLANWCGCYLPKEAYDQYTQYNVDINCTPTCNRANTIPLANDITGIPEPCTQNVCIMDDIAIRLIETESSGDISFTQACHSCGQNRVASIIDSDSGQLTLHTNNNNYTTYKIIPPSDLQATNIIPTIVQYPGGTVSQLLQPRIGFRFVSSGNTYIPANGPVNILRLDTNQSGSATFKTTSTLTTNGKNYYITGFSELPSIFQGNDNETNVPSGTLIVITQPLVSGENTYTYFQVIGKDESNINIQSTQEIGNFISQFNLGRDVNTCRCIFNDTTISLVESRLKGINLSQNCGQTETNVNGKTVPNSIDLSNNFSVQNSIKSSITSTDDFVEEIELDKTQFTITVLGVISFLIVVMQYFLTRYPRKYGRIIISTIIFAIAAIVFIYLWYSFEINWGLEQGLLSTMEAAL